MVETAENRRIFIMSDGTETAEEEISAKDMKRFCAKTVERAMNSLGYADNSHRSIT